MHPPPPASPITLSLGLLRGRRPAGIAGGVAMPELLERRKRPIRATIAVVADWK